ncbi:RNA polymerase sigma-54 factor [Methylopila capsulata]|uniref:RNA polymerase sigma-54 factor n=1 Tax=Methylopila capsulata TaxID=61654 RepID=A0A9W6IQ86_9HYPH|nr:RNA polymerase factor sigma-54 [Methylopila capsulata]MBM7851146.1 RNA polymerase sigma-54 factor [Methylopila capsulata]GLK54203.1 RNA polymerase sigma-54 factor 2 [Methylopila capsulata]
MALTPKLLLRQSQSLVMTPQLMQAIKLLQLSSLDLATYVENELEQNPLLERQEERVEDVPDEAQAQERRLEEAFEGAKSSDDWAEDGGAGSRSEIEQRLDTDFGNVFPDDAPQEAARTPAETPPDVGDWSSIGPGSAGSGEGADLEAYVADRPTLADHLERQLVLAVSSTVERAIGLHLIDLVDEAGYIREPIESIAERLGASLEAVEDVLRVIQTFEPSGVGARTLAECLAIQLRERDRYDPAMQALVENLELVARRDFAALRRLCGVDEEDLADMLAELKRLEPKPGRGFGGEVVLSVSPDVLVRLGQDGAWLVELVADSLPRVLVNQAYYAKVVRVAKDEGEKTFLTECLQTANWLTRSLEQRARTILKVATEIVRQQDGFLVHGVAHLRPLNLRTIADAIGMHESTVSRVTANKYMATPRGVFELKYFFTASIASADGGDAHSAEAVRHRIRTMIDAESPDDVLSDDTIVKRLHDGGVEIARRTVAKYRESLRIPSSVQRRREKTSARNVPAQ